MPAKKKQSKRTQAKRSKPTPKSAKPNAPQESHLSETQCGSVARNVGSPPANAKQLVLEAAARPFPPLPPSTPDDTPISAIIVGDADPITTLTGRCMSYGQFQADDLWMGRLYALKNGTKLGDFVNCIRCCYQHKH